MHAHRCLPSATSEYTCTYLPHTLRKALTATCDSVDTKRCDLLSGTQNLQGEIFPLLARCIVETRTNTPVAAICAPLGSEGTQRAGMQQVSAHLPLHLGVGPARRQQVPLHLLCMMGQVALPRTQVVGCAGTPVCRLSQCTECWRRKAQRRSKKVVQIVQSLTRCGDLSLHRQVRVTTE